MTNKEKFVEEYVALCEKYQMVITNDIYDRAYIMEVSNNYNPIDDQRSELKQLVTLGFIAT